MQDAEGSGKDHKPLPTSQLIGKKEKD